MTITGSGTSGNPYVIHTFADLELIGTSPYTLDKYFALGKDIDAISTSDPEYNSGAGWLPKGTLTGGFNGRGRTISNLYINRPTTDYVGLFSKCNGSINNLRLENCNITGQDYTAGITGYYYTANITNCHVTGTINGRDKVAGIIGQKYNSGTISYCTSDVEINAGSYVGGIIAFTTGGFTLTHCYAYGDINATGSYVGGIAGNLYNLATQNMSYCDYCGIINIGGSYAGMLAGQKGLGTVSNCYITEGEIIGSSTSDQIGGLFGFVYDGMNITNCIVTINLTGRDKIGGFVGHAQGHHNFLRCYYAGNINGRNYLGGLIGYKYPYNNQWDYTGSYSFTMGNIIGTGNYIGGLVGWSSYPNHLNNCWSKMNVTGNSYVAGFFGYQQGGIIEKCYSIGLVTGNSNIGGFIAGSQESAVANYCYFDRETSGQSSSALGSSKFTSEMKRQSTYFSWDFSAIWYIGDDYNDGYPLLRDNNNLGFIDYIDATSDIASKIYVPYTSDVLSKVCVLAIKSDILSRVIARASGLEEVSSKVFVNNKIYRTEVSDINSQVTVTEGTTASNVYSIVVVNGLITKTVEISGTIVYDHYNGRYGNVKTTNPNSGNNSTPSINVGGNPKFGVMFGGVYID